MAGETIMALIKVKERGREFVNLGRRNLVINGDMQVWQRAVTSAALTHNTDIYHSVDRWSAVLDQNEGSGTLTTTFSRDTDVPATEMFPFSLKAVVNSSSFTPSGTDCTALFSHTIETLNANPLGWGTSNAKPATLSYWIKSSVAGTGTLQLRLYDSSSVSSDQDGNYYTKFTINQANTWEKKTHLIPANVTDGWRRDVSENGIQMFWFFGSNQAAASTQDAWFRNNNYGQRHDDMTLNFQTTGGTAYLTGCQLEVGDSATEFEHRSFGEEYSLCKRYFQKTYKYDTYLTANVEEGCFDFIPTSTNDKYCANFEMSMRAAPEMTIYRKNGGGTNAAQKGDNSGNYATLSNIDIVDRGIEFSTNVTNLRHYRFHYYADAEV